MYSRYCRSCKKHHHYNPQVIENVCNDVGTSAEYNDIPCNCCCQELDNSASCSCGFDEGINLFPENPMLAQSYVPIQYMDKTFTPCCGLKMGTIFPELVDPYRSGQSMEEIAYLKARNKIGEGCNG